MNPPGWFWLFAGIMVVLIILYLVGIQFDLSVR